MKRDRGNTYSQIKNAMVFTAPKSDNTIFYPSLGLIYDNSYTSNYHSD
jgi:hypothetical protein